MCIDLPHFWLCDQLATATVSKVLRFAVRKVQRSYKKTPLTLPVLQPSWPPETSICSKPSYLITEAIYIEMDSWEVVWRRCGVCMWQTLQVS